tara:strand:- start:43 stop:1122 length:1080 start_codon:yes stop_codon:yes gene_type:complete
MAYTTINKSSSNFKTKLYVGNGGTQTISGVGFSAGLTWLKGRDSGGESNRLTDVVRGAGYNLRSNSTSGQDTSSNTLTAWNSNGFVLGANDSSNKNTKKHTSWNWKTGTSFSNNAGANGASLASTGNVNTTNGFSIVSWTSPNSNANTIAHGLGSVPEMIIIKKKGSSGGWVVYHQYMGNTHGMFLSTNAAKEDNAGFFNDTSPTSTVFTTGSDGALINNTMIAYCFASKQGYSKMGSYLGNNSAGGSATQFIYTGFKPALVMVKEVSGTSNWVVYDSTRNGSLSENNINIRQARLCWNLGDDESSFTSDNGVDLLSNGFHIKDNSNDLFTINSQNEEYMYYAVGQSLVGTNNVPCTAF